MANQYQARKYVAAAHTLRARVDTASLSDDRALAELNEAVELLHAYPAPLQAWKTYAVLGSLQQRRGNSQGAGSAFDEAAAIVYQIARNIDETALRSTFPTSRAVQEVLAGARNDSGKAV